MGLGDCVYIIWEKDRSYVLLRVIGTCVGEKDGRYTHVRLRVIRKCVCWRRMEDCVSENESDRRLCVVEGWKMVV